MKIVFRISNRLRAAAPVPRDFLPIAGLEHLGLVFNQRTYESPEEFNAAFAQISDTRFANRGCQFFPYALTEFDEAKLAAANLTPEQLEEKRLADEAAAEEAQRVADEAAAAEAKRIADAEAAVLAAESEKLESAGTSETQSSAKPAEKPEPLEFTLDGKNIMLGGERIAGLFGDSKQLRVNSDHAGLRDEIEAWLKTLTA